MRIPPVLTLRDLPEPELHAAFLDGELQRLGEDYCPVDEVVCDRHRAASIRLGVPSYAIAERLTAAWIFGATYTVRHPLQLCVEARTRIHPVSTLVHTFREVVVEPSDLVVVGGMRVTTPLRTAIDIARFTARFTDAEYETLRRLASAGGFNLADCAASMDARRNLPNKLLARTRLNHALERLQPAFTR